MMKISGFIKHYSSYHWILCYVTFMTVLLLHTLRVDLGIAFACMLKTSNSSLQELNHTGIKEECPGSENHLPNKTFEGEFEWSNSLQSQMLAGYFYGYTVTNIFGGMLADKYGSKNVLGFSIISASILALLHPSLSRISGYFTLALRILTGLVLGPMAPSVQSLWGRWAPPEERSSLVAFSFSGQTLGTIICMSISGFLCEYGFDNGWGSIFYLFGGTTLLFSCVWFCVVYDNPDDHPNINEEERVYLNKNRKDKSEVKNVPWRKILSSSAIWAITVAHMITSWTNTVFQMLLPLYMKDVLNIDPSANGLMSSTPSLGQFIFLPLSGKLADVLRSKNYLSTRSVRVIFQSISFIGSASLLVAIGFLKCDQTILIGILLFLSGVTTAFYSGGFLVNHIDVAPRYAGVLYGFTNTFASICSILCPLAVKALTPNGTQKEWRTVLIMSGALSLFAAIIYALFAKGSEQEWAYTKDNSSQISEKLEKPLLKESC
ncbi:sialin-like [Octopus sinensis]|uniref:Sialin-like n=1 Tax=Octopus sinensis TaxID=2607531 RepID=A0A7E6FMS4_9MOLL|nr:sialin-like [Octopus sinensis]